MLEIIALAVGTTILAMLKPTAAQAARPRPRLRGGRGR